MKRFLIVVDMQNDFISGSLGTPEAEGIVPAVVRKIRGFSGEIIATMDTHPSDYLNTAEGKKLPVVHCVRGTEGWQIDSRIMDALKEKGYTALEKATFGSIDLPGVLRGRTGSEPFEIELVGLCTDICVISNALLLKAAYPEYVICLDADCCAGVTPESHQAALTVMRCCQIDVTGGMD